MKRKEKGKGVAAPLVCAV